MKWVKVAIGAVIAILSIGIIATSVYGMTQETITEQTVMIELTNDGVIYLEGNYTTLVSLIGYDYDYSIYLDDIVIEDGVIIDYETLVSVSSSGEGFDFSIYSDGTLEDADEYISGVLVITFKVTQPPQLTGISATLILLAPLIFAGGVLAYLLNKQNY